MVCSFPLSLSCFLSIQRGFAVSRSRLPNNSASPSLSSRCYASPLSFRPESIVSLSRYLSRSRLSRICLFSFPVLSRCSDIFPLFVFAFFLSPASQRLAPSLSLARAAPCRHHHRRRRHRHHHFPTTTTRPPTAPLRGSINYLGAHARVFPSFPFRILSFPIWP